MTLDIIFAGLMIMAAIKGFQRGVIVAVFSVVAFIIGLAAAIKLSAVVAAHLGKAVKLSDQWLPVISFAVVFLVVILLVRLGANMLEKSVKWATLGWVNKMGGIVLYAVLYTFIFSIILFYTEKIHLLKADTIAASVTYPFVQPWGSKVIDSLGEVVPLFKNMFRELESFFEELSGNIQ